MHSNLPWCFDAVLTERVVCIPGQLLPEERDATHSLTAGARLTETTGGEGGGGGYLDKGGLQNRV